MRFPQTTSNLRGHSAQPTTADAEREQLSKPTNFWHWVRSLPRSPQRRRTIITRFDWGASHSHKSAAGLRSPGRVRTPIPAAVLTPCQCPCMPCRRECVQAPLRGALGARVKGERGENVLPKERAQTLLAAPQSLGLPWVALVLVPVTKQPCVLRSGPAECAVLRPQVWEIESVCTGVAIRSFMNSYRPPPASLQHRGMVASHR